MASVELDRVWINLAADPSQYMALSVRSLQPVPQMTVNAQPYADGNYRISTLNDWTLKLQAVVQKVTQAQRDLLLQPASMGGWLGETVCVRDPRSHKFFGFWDPPQDTAEHIWNTEVNLTLTFTRTFYSDLQ